MKPFILKQRKKVLLWQFEATTDDDKLRVNLTLLFYHVTSKEFGCSLFYRKDYPGRFLAYQASPRQSGVTRVGIENGVHMQKAPFEIGP